MNVETAGTIKAIKLRLSIQILKTKTQRKLTHVATPTVTPTSRTKLPRPHFWTFFSHFISQYLAISQKNYEISRSHSNQLSNGYLIVGELDYSIISWFFFLMRSSLFFVHLTLAIWKSLLILCNVAAGCRVCNVRQIRSYQRLEKVFVSHTWKMKRMLPEYRPLLQVMGKCMQSIAKDAIHAPIHILGITMNIEAQWAFLLFDK